MSEPSEVPSEQEDGTIVCHECDEPFDRIGYHWSNGSCDYPEIDDITRSFITGLMVGDGSLRTHTSEPFVQMYSSNKPFLDWIDSELGWISTGVSMYRTADRSAELADNGADPADYSDVYVVQTRTLDALSMFESWYTDDGKQIPSYIVLTPTTAKLWYACNGSMNWDRRYPNARPHATITVGGTADDDQLRSLFGQSTFGEEPTIDDGSVRLTTDQTERFLDWVGEPPAGVEYKWENDSLDEYDTLSAVTT